MFKWLWFGAGMVVQELTHGLLSRHTEVSGVLTLVFLVLYLHSLFRHRLVAENTANRRAMARTLGSVSDDDMNSAMNNLERHPGKFDNNQLCRLEEALKAMTLEKFDEQSVNAHLTSVRQQIQYIKESGGIMDPFKERCLIAATLPNDSNWTVFIDALKYGINSMSVCEDMIQVKCRSIRTNPGGLLHRGKVDCLCKTRTKSPIKQIDIKKGCCFKCYSKNRDRNDTFWPECVR